MASPHNAGSILQSASRSYVKPFTTQIHAYGKDRLGKLCLLLHFYIWAGIYDMKQMEGSAERAPHLFYLSVSVNPLDFSAGCKSSRSFSVNTRLVCAHAHEHFVLSSWFPISHTWGTRSVLHVISVSDIAPALTNAITAAWPFLQHRSAANTRNISFWVRRGLQLVNRSLCPWLRHQPLKHKELLHLFI